MKLFRRDIVIITLFACIVFGGIYAYYIAMFEPKDSQEERIQRWIGRAAYILVESPQGAYRD